ncbi:hypothetical protein QAO71_17050 (plasmid) [Halopseudomonas sp. SMJS2]|uniref:hypothetical protein n=1 Tax=Halopseudomonas sp. SMJS2 TaxID=3041098 RepID=UPI002452FB4D|nr:hypothetical protein [Halopseudomonas sp. SMJS2]WGK63478.1 hypothetical protein QAO71_17050 [Halopseudomonas sp. SMJS2]
MNTIITSENINAAELEAFVDNVREGLDGQLASDFSCFETFNEWIDASYHYEGMDNGQSGTVDLHRAIYDALVKDERAAAGEAE